MKILIIGGTGMLGHKAAQVLKNKFDVYATIKKEFRQSNDTGFLRKPTPFVTWMLKIRKS
jgi:dTDP-4-dehydrorhamnose reductase